MNFAPVRVVAAVWALAFAAVHVLWSTGSTVLLGNAATGRVTGWFLGYDVGAAVACLVGVVAALWGGRAVLLVATGVIGVRALLGLGQAGWLLLQGRPVLTATLWVEPFFAVGAALFAAATANAFGSVRRSRADRDHDVAADR